MLNPWIGTRVVWNLATGDLVSDDVIFSDDVENSIFQKVIGKEKIHEYEIPLKNFIAYI